MADREQVARVVRWSVAHPRCVLYDEPGQRLLDVFSGKVLPLDWGRTVDVVERTTRDTGQSYLIILRDDGAQLALAPAGLAFPLDCRNSGPLPGAPAVVCFQDFHRLCDRLEHVLRDHPDEKPSPTLLDMIRFGIGILDGARRVGLEVGEEERRLEQCVIEVERRETRP